MKKKGMLQKALKGLQEGFERNRKERARGRVAFGKMREEALEAYYKAKTIEEIKYAKTKAVVERKEKERKLKASYDPKKSTGFKFNQEPYFKSGGFAEPLFPKKTKNKKTQWQN